MPVNFPLIYLIRSYKIGQNYSDLDPSIRTIKVLWHPLSQNGSHLVILTSDGVIRLSSIYYLHE